MILKQKILIGLIIFFICLAVSFKTDFVQTQWLWSHQPFIAILLVLIAGLLARFWINIELQRQEARILQIKQAHHSTDEKQHLELLSEREQSVYKKILEGKSNKEISEELYIALSTVKTHINNIYKILQVKSRAELKKAAKIS